ncbi:MAG: hypothetical protein MJ252_02405 [archaeon]|nr:hypothetical protein [archaeon]
MNNLNKKNFLEPEEDISNQYTNLKIHHKSNNESKEKMKYDGHKLITDHNDLSLFELISALKEKIAIYETEIQKLLKEKIEMQKEINTLKEFTNNKIKEGGRKENLSLLDDDLKQNFQNQKNNINNELETLKTSLTKQKSLFNNPKFISAFKPKEKEEEKKCPNCQKKEEELLKVTSEKNEIFEAIQEMKKQLEEVKASSVNEKKKEKKKREKINKSSSLPDIEQYFILNNKFQLVDSQRNLWHMKKCRKFTEFKEQNKEKYTDPDELLKAFVDIYDNKEDEEEIIEETNEEIQKKESEENEEEKYIQLLSKYLFIYHSVISFSNFFAILLLLLHLFHRRNIFLLL